MPPRYDKLMDPKKRAEKTIEYHWQSFQNILVALRDYPGDRKSLKLFAKRLLTAAVGARDMELVRRMAGPNHIHTTTGYCDVCSVNLHGEKFLPDEKSMPCNLKGCPYE